MKNGIVFNKKIEKYYLFIIISEWIRIINNVVNISFELQLIIKLNCNYKFAT